MISNYYLRVNLYKRVKGKKYFDCPNNYGIFLRPNKLEVGDFPELDLDDEI